PSPSRSKTRPPASRCARSASTTRRGSGSGCPSRCSASRRWRAPRPAQHAAALESIAERQRRDGRDDDLGADVGDAVGIAVGDSHREVEALVAVEVADGERETEQLVVLARIAGQAVESLAEGTTAHDVETGRRAGNADGDIGVTVDVEVAGGEREPEVNLILAGGAREDGALRPLLGAVEIEA